MPVGAISAHGGATPPGGWLTCDGASLLRATYPDLFGVIGTDYGAADGDHFNVPDLRGRFVLGKAASGTGSTLGGTGGAIDHTHSGPSHTHPVTQPDAHTAHQVTQPDTHTALAHSGASVPNHNHLAHASTAIANHSISAEAGGHADHSADAGTHTHDAHPATSNRTTGGSSTGVTATTAHANDAAFSGHTHDAHPAHSGSTIDVHGLTTPNHSTDVTHTVSSQGADHTLAHAGATVTLAHTHSGAATSADGTASSGAKNPAWQASPFIIRAAP